MKGYIDLYLLPVPKKNLTAYKKISNKFGKVMKEYGALEYREFLGDDLKMKGIVPFPDRVKLKKGEILISAVVGFSTKAQRDRINRDVQNDPRIQKMIQEAMENPMAESDRMLYGGFSTLVKV